MDSQKKSATLPAGMAPPSSGSHGKAQQKLSSHSFSGGFLGRLKRRFRLKSKGYELQPENQAAVQGVRFQQCQENLAGQRLQEEGSAARGPAPADVVRTHSDRRTERPPQFRGGHKKDERKTRSDMLYDSNSAVQRNCLGKEVNVPNEYVVSDTNVIDLESDGGGITGDIFDEMDPGYETLDEVRRKMQMQFNQPQKMNGSACLPETELVCQRSKGPQHRRSQSTGHPQMAHPGEFYGMLDSGLGSPLVSDNSSSMRASDIVTKSLSVVSDTDISAYQSVNSVGYTHHDNFLSPSNLPSMRMNSCPGNTYDMSPGRSQDLLCPRGSQGVYNSDTYLPDHEVSELYANPKILMRKKSQREETEAKLRLSGHVSNRTSSNDSDEGNTSFDTDGKRSSTGDNQIEHREFEEESVPPIPERKYSLYLNQQNKRQNSQDKHVNTISVDSSYSSSVNESQSNESTCAMAENSMFSDHRGLADSAITDSVSSRILNQSADTFGQDSGFWLSEDDDILRSCDTSIHGDRSDIDKYIHNTSKQPSPAIRFENDERVILTGDVRTIAPESAKSVTDSENVQFELKKKGEIIDNLKEHISQREVSDDLYQNPWDVISDSKGQRRDITSAILRRSDDRAVASYKVQGEVIPHTVEREIIDQNSNQNDHQLLKKRNSSGSRISYKEMTVCQSASLEKLAFENTTANTGLLSDQMPSVQSSSSVRTTDSAENCLGQQRDSVVEHRNSVVEYRNSVVEHRNSIGEHRISGGETRNSGGAGRYSQSVKTDLQNTVLDATNQKQSNIHIINNKPVCADSTIKDQRNARISNDTHSQIPSKGRECPDQCATPCLRSTLGLENNSVDQSLCERDFESSLDGSTEPSIDSLGGSTDCLSEKSIEQRVVSYEDDADAVLESMDVQSDSFADEMTMSMAGSVSVQCDSNNQILEGIQGMNLSQDYDPPSDVSETLKTDSAEQETESISDPSDDIVSSASTLSPSARLPDYYYQDTEPVHMSLSELGMSDEQWVETEPIHMSVNELKRSKSHYEGEREHQSHFHTPSPSLWQSPQDYTTELRSSNSTQDHSLLPSTQQCSNVYETVDDDDQQDLETNVNVRRHGHPVMHPAYINNHGARPRRPYSVEVSSFQNRRDEDFMKRLDSRPPAVIPRTNPEEESQRDFMESMRQLKDCGWYWGPLSWDEAEIKLMNKPDGSFLVRDSSDDRYILSLSFNMQGRVHHTRIEHHKGKFSFWSQPDSHGKATIREFIEQCVKNSRNGQFLYFIRPSGPGSPPMPVHLLHPISRYKQMQSLQHMCRFQILQKVRRDHIDKLPIPTQIKDYLKDPQYYVEYLEED
ncbi:uncharacterized protein LOC110458131 isoform X2 [Mizuhopecten yessoensis]|uniref:Suppressor of cytokine signaling 7 n=1 Tax=Mizuhopecten yessoensis TaxID=6573 RepID=A0A210Q7A3_MIZYE|nr:uncharacterized protein LOC110458131 isoform X2 [Mizuhopecten yessoensis]OWF44601.1 Suppressor of cytokine signaling 7 [Mizuhopecten yessoensis]